MRVHFGSVTAKCSTDDQAGIDSGRLATQLKSESIYPIDTKALTPKCIHVDNSGKELIVYEVGENIWLWVSVGLVGLLFLILVFSAFKGRAPPYVLR